MQPTYFPWSPKKYELQQLMWSQDGPRTALTESRKYCFASRAEQIVGG